MNEEGGCLCGAVRFRLKGKPVRVSACHCSACQRRTGSAFGTGAYCRAEDVEITRGELRRYEHRSDESKRWIRYEFCGNCGTQLTWTAEALPGMRAVGLGTFDNPQGFKVERHGWMRSAHSWFTPPADTETFETSALIPPEAAGTKR